MSVRKERVDSHRRRAELRIHTNAAHLVLRSYKVAMCRSPRLPVLDLPTTPLQFQLFSEEEGTAIAVANVEPHLAAGTQMVYVDAGTVSVHLDGSISHGERGGALLATLSYKLRDSETGGGVCIAGATVNGGTKCRAGCF
jgi:hypothetical protein